MPRLIVETMGLSWIRGGGVPKFVVEVRGFSRLNLMVQVYQGLSEKRWVLVS